MDSLLKSSVHGNRTDVHALATAGKHSVSVMVWNYHDDGIGGPAVRVTLHIKNIPTKKASLQEFRIDEEHSNAYTVWQKMGSPQSVTEEQYQTLEKAGKLQLLNPGASQSCSVSDKGEVNLLTILPRHAVSLLRLNW